MNIRWQALILIILVLGSLTFTKLSDNTETKEEVSKTSTSTAENLSVSYQRASLSNFKSVKKAPTRKWDILDPETSAETVLVHSLDDDSRLYYENTQEEQVLASLTKLLTAVVVIEDIGLNKGIPITREAVGTRGIAGGLKSGESYSARELLKIMLLTSSNDAAYAFGEYMENQENLVRAIHQKAAKLNLESIAVKDGSGLSDFNHGTARDFLKLTKYITKNHPQIFTWTQSPSFLVQPLNDKSTSRKIKNINPLARHSNFWGGKTGTSKAAGENLVSIFNIASRRVAVILMDSENRYKDASTLINWVKKAYTFPNH